MTVTVPLWVALLVDFALLVFFVGALARLACDWLSELEARLKQRIAERASSPEEPKP